MKNLPSEARRNFESEEERKRRVKLKEVKETMWKRTRIDGENLQREDNLQTGEDHYKSLTELENKLKDLEAIQEKCDREEKEKMETRKINGGEKMEERGKIKIEEKTRREVGYDEMLTILMRTKSNGQWTRKSDRVRIPKRYY